MIDTLDRRILRQRQGQLPMEVRYREPGQIATWYDEAGQAVAIELKDLFPLVPDPSTTADDQLTDFAAFNSAEVARLQRFETPWTIGHTPQWFNISISPLLGQFKDELWGGSCLGPSINGTRSCPRYWRMWACPRSWNWRGWSCGSKRWLKMFAWGRSFGLDMGPLFGGSKRNFWIRDLF